MYLLIFRREINERDNIFGIREKTKLNKLWLPNLLINMLSRCVIQERKVTKVNPYKGIKV